MSPPEHNLSQRVLEFLIAQQDWFMLDIPPPPQHEPGSPESWDDDVLAVDDEHSPVGGAWNLVGKGPPAMTRRRTTVGG